MDPYSSLPLSLASDQSWKLDGKVMSYATLTATYPNDVSVSFNGAAFFNLPIDVVLEFREPTEVWVKNTNALANAILAGSGSSKITRSVTSGGSIVISGTAATSIADGQDVTLGAKADAAATTDAGTFTLVSLFKRLLGKLGALVKSTYTVDAAASTNAAVVKNAAGRVYAATVVNCTAAIKVVRLYDLAVAPTVGTSVATRVIAVPANSTMHLSWPAGDSYATGIAIAITGAIAYNDATAVAAHDVQVALSYE